VAACAIFRLIFREGSRDRRLSENWMGLFENPQGIKDNPVFLRMSEKFSMTGAE
jgi:hypothetical protein